MCPSRTVRPLGGRHVARERLSTDSIKDGTYKDELSAFSGVEAFLQPSQRWIEVCSIFKNRKCIGNDIITPRPFAVRGRRDDQWPRRVLRSFSHCQARHPKPLRQWTDFSLCFNLAGQLN